MAIFTTGRLVGFLALVVALLSVVLPSPLNWAIGRYPINPLKLIRWKDSAPINNDCVVHQEANACEDAKIHFASNTAFLACGDPAGRSSFYPGGQRHDAQGRQDFREKLFKYDIKEKKTTELKVEGLDKDFVTHGLDVFDVPGDKSKVHIMAVRHGRREEAISIFSHTLGTDTATLVKDVQHSAIRNPNGVAAIGPLEFYVTNDHYYMSGDALRPFEEWMGPWHWATNVAHCDASQEEIRCREVASGFVTANGLAVADGKAFVGDVINASVSIFEIGADKSLTLENSIALGAPVDNVRFVPTTGDIVAAVFPVPKPISKYFANPQKLGREMLVPSAALRLRKAEGYAPELLYWDSGSVISFMTTFAVDPFHGLAVGTGVLQYGGFAVCALNEETVKAFR